MDEGKIFQEKQQMLLNSLYDVFEQFSAEFSARYPLSENNPEILKKLQEYRVIVQQKHQELISNCLEMTDLTAHFEYLFQQAPVPYLLLDTSQKIAALNLAAAQLLKAPAEKLIGKELGAFVSEQHNHPFTAFFNHFPNNRSRHLVIKMVAWDGIPFFANMYCTRMEKKENSLQYLTIIHDIDAFKQKEELLLQEKQLLVQENAELERFIYSASHDLRSPMVSIMGVINVARMETQDEQMIVYLDFIEMSVRKLDNFVQDLINLSKNSTTDLRIEKIKLPELISGIFDQLQYIENVKRIRKVIEVHDTADFHSDKERLSIILNNLLSNAIKYHHFNQEDPFIEISIISEEKQAVICLQDNGQGIAAEHLDKIFNKFYRASQNSKGSGLGLFIVKETLEKLGGNIQASSTVGKGTTFIITLPNQVRLK